jgi:hypothetical protein
LNNDDYKSLLEDAWSESPGDKLTCHDVTPEQIEKLIKFRKCVEMYFLFTQEYFWKFQGGMVDNRTVEMFDDPYFPAITWGSELVAGSFWRDMPGNVRAHGYFGESFLPKQPRTVRKPKSVSAPGTVRKMVIHGGTPFDLTVCKLCDSASKTTRGHQWRQTLIAATGNPYLLDSPFQTAWGPPNAAGGPAKTSELYTYEAQEFEKFEVPKDGNCFYYAAWICQKNDFGRKGFVNWSEDDQNKAAETGQSQIRASVTDWFVKHRLWLTHKDNPRNIMETCAVAMFDKLTEDCKKSEQELNSWLEYMATTQVTIAEQQRFDEFLTAHPNVRPVECVVPPTTPAEKELVDIYFKLFLDSCAGTGWADQCCAYAIAGLPELPEQESPEQESPKKARVIVFNTHVRIFAKGPQGSLYKFEDIGRGNPVTINMLFNGIDHYDALIPRRASGDDLRQQQNAEKHDAPQAAAAKRKKKPKSGAGGAGAGGAGAGGAGAGEGGAGEGGAGEGGAGEGGAGAGDAGPGDAGAGDAGAGGAGAGGGAGGGAEPPPQRDLPLQAS